MTTAAWRQRVRLCIVTPDPFGRTPATTYIDELCRLLPGVAPEIALSVWTIVPPRRDEPPRGGPHPAGVIDAADPSAYRRAAQQIRRLGAHLVLIEHEPGCAGGGHDRYLLALTGELTRLAVPYLVTLHDMRSSPHPDAASVRAALCRDAAGVIVLSDAARSAVVASRLARPDRIAVVPQGAPPELLRADAGRTIPRDVALAAALAGPGPVLATIGQLRPAKGIEVAVHALPLLDRRRPGIRYIVAAPTDTRHARIAGERYRRALHRAAVSLGAGDRLHLLPGDLGRDDLARLLRATAVYLSPDLDTGRTSSGSLTYAIAAGCPTVATDTPFAREMLPRATRRLVQPADPAALAAAVTALLDAETGHTARPVPHLSSVHAAEQLAGLVHLVTSHRPADEGAVGGRIR